MPVAARPVPQTSTYTAVSSAVISTIARTRVSYLSVTNNDAAPRYLALFDATSLNVATTPKYCIGPIAAGTTYVCTNVDLKPAGLIFDVGVVVALSTTPIVQAAPGVAPANTGVITLGTSGTFVVWTEIEP